MIHNNGTDDDEVLEFVHLLGCAIITHFTIEY